MILLDFGDSTGQRKSLDKTVAYRCIFLRNVVPLLRRSTCFCCLIGCFGGFFDHPNAFSNPSHDRYGHAVA